MAEVIILSGDAKGERQSSHVSWLTACAHARQESTLFEVVAAVDGDKKAVYQDGVCIRAYPRTVEIA